MSQVVAFKPAVRRKNHRLASRMAVVTQIVEALEKLGGSAHYDRVIDQIAADRGIIDVADRETLRRRVVEVFKAHCEAEAKSDEEALFRRVYGADSRRWGFSPRFHERLRAGVVDLTPAP